MQSERFKASNAFATNSGKRLPAYLIFSPAFLSDYYHPRTRNSRIYFLFTVSETPSCRIFWLFPDLSLEKNFPRLFWK